MDGEQFESGYGDSTANHDAEWKKLGCSLFSIIQWGIYYRKDIYDKLGLSEPKTLNELLSSCDALEGVGVTPFTIGTKYLWTAAGAFDCLNLRTNGCDVHNALMAEEIKYTDARIRATFAN